MDYLGLINEFVYFGKKSIEERNLNHIVGYYESYLNSASFSYEQGFVTDWIDYLRQDWALVLYQDKFHNLVNILKKSLSSDQGFVSFLEKIFEIADSSPDDHHVSLMRR